MRGVTPRLGPEQSFPTKMVRPVLHAEGSYPLEKEISSANLKTTREHFPSVGVTCPCPQNQNSEKKIFGVTVILWGNHAYAGGDGV